MNHTKRIRTVVLAYSGGLDTSVIVRWLEEQYDCEVVTFTADIGQGEEVAPARAKAEALGVRQIFIEDLREEFTRDYVWPMFRANTVYEGEYMLGTAIARPLIAHHLVRIAREVGADAVAHGATGKGNDQLRFELGVSALAPELQIIAPWRHPDWQMLSREQLIRWCEKRGIAVENRRRSGTVWSMDANLLHVSYEGGELEDPNQEPPADMWRRTVDPRQAPDQAEEIEIGFDQGDPVRLNNRTLSAAAMLERLNALGGAHGIGRADLVENRAVGIKSRGCYETPGGTILLRARRAMESLTLDREVAHLKDRLMPQYAEMIYNGYWWSPERAMIQAAIDHSQQRVTGSVRLRLYRGAVAVLGRLSPYSLYDATLATFEDDDSRWNQADAGGFIRIQAERLKLAARQGDEN